MGELRAIRLNYFLHGIIILFIFLYSYGLFLLGCQRQFLSVRVKNYKVLSLLSKDSTV